MKMSLSEAADAVKCSKTTIWRGVKSGKLSAKKNEDGEYEIDPAELYRVYPKENTVTDESLRNGELQRSATHEATTSQGHMKQVEWFQEMVKSKDEELSQVRAELNDARERLTEHREASRALIDPQTFEEKQAEWKQALAERQEEIKQARKEVDEIRSREQSQAVELQAERKRVAALESQGFLDRLLNRKIKLVEELN